MNAMLDIARRRYTTKHYDPAKPLSDEDLDALLEVLRLAPASVNIQPGHFYAVKSAEAKAKLMPAVKDFNVERVRDAAVIVILAVERDISSSGYLDRLLAQEVADGRYAPDAPRASLDSLRRSAVAAYCAGPDHGERWASEQAHIALGCLLMAAEGMGVDSTTLGGLYFDEVDRIFGLAEAGRKSVVAVALGHRAADDSNASRPKSRFPKEAVTTVL